MLRSEFKEALPIIEQIEQNYFHAYFVGGAVRDYLLQREIDDIDIATNASVEDLKLIFPDFIPVGIDHGTVMIRHHGVSYEVTTFRGNLYRDLVQSLQDDMRLRDFTMNALAMDKRGAIFDFYGGQRDMRNKVLRAVEDPQARFKEDPLRLLRAIRFVSELSYKIEKTTLHEMGELAALSQNLARERILQEWIKIIQAPYLAKAVVVMKETKILQYLPVFKEEAALMEKMYEQRDSFDSFSTFLAYFHYHQKDVSVNQWIKAWKASNEQAREAKALVKALDYFEKKGLDVILLYEIEEKALSSFVFLVNRIFSDQKLDSRKLIEQKALLPIQSRKELAVNGNDLINWLPDQAKGSWIRLAIEEIERAVLLKKVKNNKNDIKEWILCHPPDIGSSNY